MIDKRFSAHAFEMRGLNSDAARQLADCLAEESQQEMHKVIAVHLKQIIEQLNSMGHNLQPYGEIVPGEIAYRDDTEDKTGYYCKLRVAFDSIVSTGYAHTLSSEEIYADDLDVENLDRSGERQTAA